MRKISKKVLVCGLVAVCLTCGTADAATLKYGGGDSEISVSGNTGIKRMGQAVTLNVSDSNNNILFIRQTETDKNGQYKFSFELTQYGDAVASVSENGVLQAPLSIYKSTVSEIETALALVNGTGSIADVITEAKNGDTDAVTALKVLQVDISEFEALNTDEVLAGILDSQQFADLASFAAGYDVAEFLAKCRNTTSASELSTLMKSYAEQFATIDESAYTSYLVHKNKNAALIFEKYDTTKREAVLTEMYGKTFDSFEGFYDTLYDLVLTRELNGFFNYNEKFNLCSNNNDFLNLDFNKYSALGDYYDDFQKQAFNGTYTDISDLKTKCESAYQYWLTIKNAAGNNNNSGGGGGGGGTGTKEETQTIKVDTELLDKNTAVEISFDDIENHQWAKMSILELAQKGIVSGKSKDVFAPNDATTRAEFVKILVGALEIPPADKKLGFTDISEEHWAYSAVSAAVEAGIVYGLTGELFGTNQTITREEMAAMCYRAMQYKQMSINGQQSRSFSDADEVSGFAKEAVAVMGGEGIINGRGNDLFCPKELLTRAETAKICHSLMLRLRDA